MQYEEFIQKLTYFCNIDDIIHKVSPKHEEYSLQFGIKETEEKTFQYKIIKSYKFKKNYDEEKWLCCIFRVSKNKEDQNELINFINNFCNNQNKIDIQDIYKNIENNTEFKREYKDGGILWLLVYVINRELFLDVSKFI